MRLAIVLAGVSFALNATARLYPSFKARLREKKFVAQISTRDSAKGRYFKFGDGRVVSKAGTHPKPDMEITFRTAELGFKLLTPPFNHGDFVNAMKNFNMEMSGPDDITLFFTNTISLMQTIRWKSGTKMPNGETRFVNNTNGGPLFVYVKDGKIVRMTPLDLDESDASSWEVKAQGKTFSPERKTTISPHGLASKSLVYSSKRLMYPMKRVDFDPNGERNPQNRGISGYERISWDEALDIVSGEIKRMKREHGHGAILCSHSSHHTWGNIGYYLSSMHRFMNAIGHTKMALNPDSWEGWYWGAMHHYGHSMRNGAAETYTRLEDCFENCEMMVFWASDPETTSGSYAAFEATRRRMWAKELGIKMVHIDPYNNHTANFLGGKWIPVIPGTSPALAHAIAYVWMTEGLYDMDYVRDRTTGFAAFEAYILGTEDGVPKSPEWQAEETGVDAATVRALAREWGSKRTYLSAGGKGTTFGGANRSSTGTQWARAMVCLMAMQGLGKPGINFGNLQYCTPVDLNFYFPAYAEGGFSGDLEGTASAVQNYQRMPHLPSVNTVGQKIPRLRIPEALMDGETHGYPTNPKSIEGQFARFGYPAPGHSKVHMMYKYGGSHFGTTMESNRLAKAYRSPGLEFVVNQSIWNEGEAPFADVILPACTNFERDDIGEWAAAGGYSHHNQGQLNHRVIAMQHKCIEPLGESKSDFQIFLDLAKRLGLSAYFAEGKTELEWCQMQFLSSDLPKKISWSEFLKKGYYVVPHANEQQVPETSYKWYAEGKKKNVPEPHPLPAEYGESYLEGLQTQSGKIEFEASSLKRFDDPGRPPVNKYIPSWEGRQTTDLYAKYPLQLISPHPRYSFHTKADGKDSYLCDIEEHRVLVDGHYYWTARINRQDAEMRGIKKHDLIKLYNDRGAVVCAAIITDRIMPGVIHSYESSAEYKPIGIPGESVDIGGCVNVLTSKRHQTEKTSASAPNACLIQVEKWDFSSEIGSSAQENAS
jgi:molybdopterin guanine dinucleotide-containing S/N-oxide reductase-like protein